ncbi:hypothetical protein JTB14_034807 [Gonioctena quinquepunctata]|nr:hypothetical protein JTB14_034807 [Gonioctena quinquepunctata]
MRTIQLVLFFASVYNSLQEHTLDLKKYLSEEFLNATRDISPHPDAGKDVYELLRTYGYKVETHWITTEDGYELRMHRIPHGINDTTNEVHKSTKPAVLLMHGLLSSSADWLVMGPNKSLGYILADAGFDVWLGNNRGNTWSRNHMLLDPKEDAKKFWDFSFEDCGYYDLPAKIDYIIGKTGLERIFYIGHSQGTSQYFAMASLRPEYNEKIALMSALAPVAYMKKMSSPILRVVAKYYDILTILADLLNLQELLPNSKLISLIATLMCSDGSPFQELCGTFLFAICGFNPPQLDKKLMPVLATGAPAGISLKMLKHFGQEINSGYFRRYDYGLRNIRKYNQTYPPNFPLSEASAPIALYYSQNDFFAAIEDVDRLASELPNVVKKRMIENKKFNHLDFIFAKDSNELINNDLVEHMKLYINSTTPTTTPQPTTPKPTTPKPNAGYSTKSSVLLVYVVILVNSVKFTIL